MMRALQLLGVREVISLELFFWTRKLKEIAQEWTARGRASVPCYRCLLGHRARFWIEMIEVAEEECPL